MAKVGIATLESRIENEDWKKVADTNPEQYCSVIIINNRMINYENNSDM